MLKPLLLAALLTSTLTGPPAHASVRFGDGFDCGEPLRWADRHDVRDARIAITTEDGKVTLLLTRHLLAMQLSERTMHKVESELHRKQHAHDEDDNVLADALRTAVIGAVRALLDHSAECPVSEIRDVRYEGGRLVIVARKGDRLFDRLDVDDRDVLECFDARDAQDFVREFRRLRADVR
jgi:hypothetical protein